MKPRVGFAGLGWIGRHRLKAIAESGVVDIAVLADVDVAAVEASKTIAPAARVASSFEELLGSNLDGIVIATPTGAHADQAMAALAQGSAVFCQKPLAGSAARARQVVDQARAANRLLGVDLSYRHARAMQSVRTLALDGSLGRIFSSELIFHNAYGPDKPWYYDPAQSGGGCLMDLGIHLADQILWLHPGEKPRVLSARLFSEGRPWMPGASGIEDFATAHLQLPSGGVVGLTCSWRAPAGADAVIGITLMGTLGGARAHNVSGSFYDFAAERLDRGSATTVCEPPDDWGGRAAVAWARTLADDGEYQNECEELVVLSEILDDIYQAAATSSAEGPSDMMRSSREARCAAV
jgi:predicted dehydrogenase